MQNIDLAYLVNIGARIRTLLQLDSKSAPTSQWATITVSREAIEELVFRSVYSSYFNGPLQASATKLLSELDVKLNKAWPENENAGSQLNEFETGQIIARFNRFEAVLESELQGIGGYLVTKKSGFEITSMVANGTVFFPKGIAEAIPEAVDDLNQAMRCIAFELPTAAGFHLHRANEAVLRRYWDTASAGQDRPKKANMGVYLAALKKEGFGKQPTLDQLKSLKDFHRNPLMHPEQSLETVDDAVDLMAAIRCSIGYMLQEISASKPAPTVS